jgi:hypothetical protein
VRLVAERLYPGAVFVILILPLISFGESVAATPTSVLEDSEGDVRYDVLYSAERTHNYLDIRSFSFSHDSATDVVNGSLIVTDTRTLSSPQPDYLIGCVVEFMALVEGRETSKLVFSTFKRENSGQFSGGVHIQKLGHDASPGLRNSFSISNSSLGSFSWAVERNLLLNAGNELVKPKAQCYENYYPGGITKAATNDDAAESKSEFSLMELRRDQSSAVEEKNPVGNESAPPTVTRDTPSTPFPGVLAAVGLTLAIIHGSRRR